MFSFLKSFDNRKETKANKLPTIKGRTWTRRIQWLQDQDQIKLKLEDGTAYREVLVSQMDANTIWTRFREGQSINDCISFLGQTPPESLMSRRAKESQ